MKASVLSITIDRSTGRELDRKIIGYEEIDEDAYYRPLIEMFGKRVLEAMEKLRPVSAAGESGKEVPEPEEWPGRILGNRDGLS